MKPYLLIAAVVASALVVRSTFALDEHIRVRPNDGHVSVMAERTDKGHIRFTVSRDTAKNPGKSRQGWLTLTDEAGFLAECAVESRDRAGHLTFFFELSPGSVGHSKFTLNEVVPTSDGEELQVGGATILEIRLVDFISDGLEVQAPTANRSVNSDAVRLGCGEIGNIDMPKSARANERELEERLLQLDVDEAESALTAAIRRSNRLQELGERGDKSATGPSVDEIEAAQSVVSTKEIELKRVKTRLELFQVKTQRR